MKNNKFNIFNLLIYFLILILFLIICLNFYKILKSQSEININISSKKNKNLQKNNSNELNEVYYNEKVLSKIPNISEADIVYQWFDTSINSLCYSSIMYNKNITNSSSISFKNPVDISELPSIKFVDLITFDKTNFIEGGKNIIFTFPNDEVIKFCFKDDIYYSYEKNKDNSIEISPVHFTNIVIMKIKDHHNDYVFNNKFKITGEGFVFSNGKYKEVIFKDNLIFDNISNSQVSLLKGNTYWCFLNSDSTIEFSD